MELAPAGDPNSVFILACDGDPTIREGDWLRLWNSLGVGVAHEVWVGTGGIVYENSGPGGFVRRNTLGNVLVARKAIHIVAPLYPSFKRKWISPNPRLARRGPAFTTVRILQVRLPRESRRAFSATHSLLCRSSSAAWCGSRISSRLARNGVPDGVEFFCSKAAPLRRALKQAFENRVFSIALSLTP